MKLAFSLALGVVLGAAAAPAYAQLGPSGVGGGMGAPGGGPAPQPLARTPDIAPSGVPGLGTAAPLATGPKLPQAASGDPTQQLFAAVNKDDYNSAQDAISRGADLNAKDPFGETPLDLAIALNRTAITFMLLQTRNELAADGNEPVGSSWSLNNAAPATAGKGKPGHASPVQAAKLPASRAVAHPRANAGPGTPDPAAGFLGFGGKP